MNPSLLKVCVANRGIAALFYEYHHLTQTRTIRASITRTVATAARLRRLRADWALASPSTRRRRSSGSQSLQRFLRRHLTMTSQHEIRRRSSAADRTTPVVPVATAAASAATTATWDDTSTRTSTDQASGEKGVHSATMPPPPPQNATGQSSPRQSRPTSPATRNANRLSLTLPIAPPTSDPSRPAPMSASISSVPGTPINSAGSSTHSDTNEFIIAIAAQERRVLELKEQLMQAEVDLAMLKKKLPSQDGYNHRTRQARYSYHAESTRSSFPGDEDRSTPRHSMDLDRRKMLLQQSQNTPTQNRRRVMRGGHTRTLSLLSPAKTTDAPFNVLEDRQPEPLGLPPIERRAAQLTNPNLAKRASWQPQSAHNQAAGMPSFVEDFRLGLKAFVEDIRQITVGDEPITGQDRTSPIPQQRRTLSGTDQDTVRASQTARPKVSNAFDSPSSATSSPTPSTRGSTSLERTKSARGSKHFLWTPLSFDSLDDGDWSSWESPASTKPARWSGSTVNNGGIEDIQSIPEAGEEGDDSL